MGRLTLIDSVQRMLTVLVFHVFLHFYYYQSLTIPLSSIKFCC